MSKRFKSDRNPIHLERNGQTAPAPRRGPTWRWLGQSGWGRGSGGERGSDDERTPSENHDEVRKLMIASVFFLFYLKLL